MNIILNKRTSFIRKLSRWFRKNHRSYPWRNTQNPYEILISEFLLQKTNADLALQTYKQVLKIYPTPKSLARASLSKLERIILPIGLSYRAERLIRVAKHLVKEFSGQIPQTRKELLKLYGVGLYISNAILCFAYDKRVAIIDTNIIRIFSRVFGVKSNFKRPRTDTNIERQIEFFLPMKSPREFNYALLDFGAAICTAKRPKCNFCPVNDLCKFYNESAN
jgi:A/G-specific adenine glycosylase